MITISGKITNAELLLQEYTPATIQHKLIDILSSSDAVYDYKTINELKFELDMRNSIIEAARILDGNYFKFRVFKKAVCNSDYWELTDEGGFLLKENVKPFDAVNDIFENGYKYGTECSTAIIIIYYGALLKLYPAELYNSIFKSIQLMNWHYIDDTLDVSRYKNVPDYLPGDCRYFVNPDFDPEKPEWQGENVIDLGNGQYYGHGLDIGDANHIIKSLNKYRKSNSTQSAYLKDSSIRPNFKHLYDIYLNYTSARFWDDSTDIWNNYRFFI